MFDLREQIELRRAEMIHLAEEYGLLDEQVFAKSQELDLLINEFERSKLSNKGKKWAIPIG